MLYINEIWKPVKDFEGYYEVSNYGRVKSLSRKVKTGRGFRLTKERIIKPSLGTDGYLFGFLTKECKKTRFTCHQLVAINFLGHVKCGFKLVVNHIDLNKTNNHVSNLEIVPHRVNSNLAHKKSSSQYVGVYFHKSTKKWSARIFVNGKRKHLGEYKNEYDAHLAYQKELQIENKKVYDSLKHTINN